MTNLISPPDARAECPACSSREATSFFTIENVPAHSVLLMETQAQAVSYPRGRIDLHRCPVCGFIFNEAFDPSLHQYSERYEETQGFSSTFREFHQRLAERLIEVWNLRGKRVLEIGCGKGEFLALLCELGGNAGVGFDPSFVPERGPRTTGVDLRFHRETYPPHASAAVLEAPPDFVCCKMTLEHIPDVRDFVTDVRRSLPAKSGTVSFFQVPNAERVFRDAAFWDIYYEHCSYFTRASLTRLFETCGFRVAEVWTDYDDQYLMISAVTSELDSVPESRASPSVGVENGRGASPDLGTFADRVASDAAAWRSRIGAEVEGGGSVCLWGAGSKAVAFLSIVGSADHVSFAVDINPHKVGTYLPGSGLEIVGPEGLRGRAPTLVIAMNPVYVAEIGVDMRRMGMSASVEAVA